MRGKLTNCRTCCQDCTLAGTESMPKSCVSYKPQITNADRIRAMTDEELGMFLGEWAAARKAWREDGRGAILDWLQQPCEDSPTWQKG